MANFSQACPGRNGPCLFILDDIDLHLQFLAATPTCQETRAKQIAKACVAVDDDQEWPNEYEGIAAYLFEIGDISLSTLIVEARDLVFAFRAFPR